MKTARIYSAQLAGLEATIVSVETDVSRGLHSFSLVGLGDRAVAEAKDRIAAAIKNSGFVSPKQENQRVVISLAPADIKKEGASFDVAMALSYLAASEKIALRKTTALFFGELALDGSIRPIEGMLPLLSGAQIHGFTEAYIPFENRTDAHLVSGMQIYAVSRLSQIIAHLSGTDDLEPIAQAREDPKNTARACAANAELDMQFIRGNDHAKRAAEIAVAGGHHLALYGPPGTGKTMLAHSLRTLMPPLTAETLKETMAIRYAARTPHSTSLDEPPFRAPHHTTTPTALIGGMHGPGEITFAHRGILFLDELPEFDQKTLDALRQPLESGEVSVARPSSNLIYPARFLLVAAMNPCPCGYAPDPRCVCTASMKSRYQRRMSGPLADRIDLWVGMREVDHEKIVERANARESSASIRQRIYAARARQAARFANSGMQHLNGEMRAREIAAHADLSAEARALLKKSAQKMGLSARGMHRVMKISRTIADLEGKDEVAVAHLLEALRYRVPHPPMS